MYIDRFERFKKKMYECYRCIVLWKKKNYRYFNNICLRIKC